MATTKSIGSATLGLASRPRVGICQPRDRENSIPDSFVLGHSPWSHKVADPVMVGNHVVDKEDLLEVRQRTSALPRWMLVVTGGSQFSFGVHAISWTSEEEKEITG